MRAVFQRNGGNAIRPQAHIELTPGHSNELPRKEEGGDQPAAAGAGGSPIGDDGRDRPRQEQQDVMNVQDTITHAGV